MWVLGCLSKASFSLFDRQFIWLEWGGSRGRWRGYGGGGASSPLQTSHLCHVLWEWLQDWSRWMSDMCLPWWSREAADWPTGWAWEATHWTTGRPWKASYWTTRRSRGAARLSGTSTLPHVLSIWVQERRGRMSDLQLPFRSLSGDDADGAVNW